LLRLWFEPLHYRRHIITGKGDGRVKPLRHSSPQQKQNKSGGKTDTNTWMKLLKPHVMQWLL
jgi:hypothetical protein